MQHHLISVHPEVVPSWCRQSRVPVAAPQVKVPIDDAVCWDYAVKVCLHSLQPPHLLNPRHGFRQWIDAQLSGMCGEKAMAKVVRDVNTAIHAQVQAELLAAKAQGFKFTIQGDGWKPNM